MIPYIFITAIFGTHILAGFVEAQCPLITRVPECSCKTLTDHNKEEYSILTCSNINDEDLLKLAIQSTKGYLLYELELVNSSFRYIPRDAFDGTFYEVISIRNSSINALSDSENAFEGLEEQLRLIEIVDCRYGSNWDWNQLSNMVQLMEFHISNSEIANVAEGISRIQHIDIEAFVLMRNYIENLDDRAFAPFSSLHRLILDNNNIQHLRRTMFPRPAQQLRVLGLNYNKLQELPEDLFIDMPKLRSIYLSGNPLHTIDEFVFRPIWNQIKIFLFYDTNLSCDCRINWMTKTNNTRKYMHADCSAPPHLKGRLLSLVEAQDLWCY